MERGKERGGLLKTPPFLRPIPPVFLYHSKKQPLAPV